jgi:hypothetical protein
MLSSSSSQSSVQALWPSPSLSMAAGSVQARAPSTDAPRPCRKAMLAATVASTVSMSVSLRGSASAASRSASARVWAVSARPSSSTRATTSANFSASIIRHSSEAAHICEMRPWPPNGVEVVDHGLVDAPRDPGPQQVGGVAVEEVVVAGPGVAVPVAEVDLGGGEGQVIVEVDPLADLRDELIGVGDRVEVGDQRLEVHEVDVVAVVLIEVGDRVGEQVDAVGALVHVAVVVAEPALEEDLVVGGLDGGVEAVRLAVDGDDGVAGARGRRRRRPRNSS